MFTALGSCLNIPGPARTGTIPSLDSGSTLPSLDSGPLDLGWVPRHAQRRSTLPESRDGNVQKTPSFVDLHNVDCDGQQHQTSHTQLKKRNYNGKAHLLFSGGIGRTRNESNGRNQSQRSVDPECLRIVPDKHDRQRQIGSYILTYPEPNVPFETPYEWVSRL